MNVTPIGGKSPSSTLVGVAVDADGVVKVKRVWETEKVTVMEDMEIRDTSKHSAQLDVSNAATVSLRIRNTTGKPFTLGFNTDNTDGNGYIMYGPSDSILSVAIGTQTNIIVTPDHAPILQYIKLLRLSVKFDEAPTTGVVGINAMIKR